MPVTAFNIIESISNVALANGFLFNMSLIVVIGMFTGVKYNEGKIGFSRSLVIMAPFSLILILTNAMRIYEVALEKDITSSAFNASITIAFTSFFYILGLFIGHVLFHKAKEEAVKNHSRIP